MRRALVSLLVVLPAAVPVRAAITDVRINEAYASHAGTDTVEFIELFGPAGTSLEGLTVLVIEGDGSARGTIINVETVTGILPADGLWVIGSAGTPNPGPEDPPDQLISAGLQNGTQTCLLVIGFSGQLGHDVDANNDGVIDSSYTGLGTIIDAVAVHDGGPTDATYAGAPVIGPACTPGNPCEPAGVARKVDGMDTDTTADWTQTSFDLIPPATGIGADGFPAASPGIGNFYLPNNPPVAVNGSAQVLEGATAGVIVTLQATDDGIPGPTLRYIVTTLPAKGVLTDPDSGDTAVNVGAALAGNRVRYIPNAGQTGSDSFTFKASDTRLDSNIATVAIAIQPNAAPVAQDGSVNVLQDSAPGPTITLQATDDGLPSPTLVFIVTLLPVKGTLTTVPGGATVIAGQPLPGNQIRYTPTAGQSGPDSFRFKANDGAKDSNEATVSISIQQNQPPVALPGTLTVPWNANPGPVVTLQATDDGLPGPALIFRIVSAPAKGTLTDPLNADVAVIVGAPLAGNRVRYTPFLNQSGPDSFSFRAGDGALDSNTATVSIEITTVPRIEDLRINEAYADMDGADTIEFVELAGPAPLDLSPLRIVVIEGDSGTTLGNITKVYNLNGLSMPADGLFVAGTSSTPNVDLISGSPDLQNGAQTYLLVSGYTPPAGNDVDPNNDGVADVSIGTLIDAVAVFDASGTNFAYYGAPIVQGPSVNIARICDRKDTDTPADWVKTSMNPPPGSGNGTDGRPFASPGLSNDPLYGGTCGPLGRRPVLTAAVSRMTHGPAGTFDLNVLAAGAVEGRAGGPTTLVATFDIPIQLTAGNASVTLSSGTVSGLAVAGTQLTVTLGGATNGQPLVVAFPGVADTVNAAMTSAGTLCFGVLRGDGTGDRTANLLDIIQIRNRLGQNADGNNFRFDINPDGSMNLLDIIQVRNNFGLTVPSCP